MATEIETDRWINKTSYNKARGEKTGELNKLEVFESARKGSQTGSAYQVNICPQRPSHG